MKQLVVDLLAHPFYRVIVIIALLGTLVLALQILWLAARWMRERSLDRARKRFDADLASGLPEAASDPGRREGWLVRARAYPDQILREAIEPAIMGSEGQVRAGLLEVYEGLGLLAADVRSASSSFWHRRIIGLRRLAQVRQIAPRSALVRFSKDFHSARILAAHALSEAGRADDVFDVISNLELPWRLMERPLFLVLNEMPQEMFESVLERWYEIESEHTRKVLLIAAALRCPERAKELLEQASSSSAVEIRLGAGVAAANLAGGNVEGVLLGLLSDGAFEVRAQAARGLGQYPTRNSASALTEGLKDPSFWVRQNAAASLASQGKEGLAALRRVMQDSSDRFAAQVAAEELERGLLHAESQGDAA